MKYLYFSSSWCGPCKTFGPIMQEVMNEGIPVTKIDTDQAKELVKEYKITGIPTIVLVDDEGKEYSRHSGVQLKEFVINNYNNYIK